LIYIKDLKMTPLLLKTLLSFAAALAASAPLSSMAQANPKALSIIVPQPAGNPTDGVARKLQPLLQKELGQTVIVENLPGAGGSIGVSKLLNTPADGNTVLIASQTEPILTPLTFSQAKYQAEDLKAIALVARLPYILVGRLGLPAQNLAELVSYAKKQGSQTLNFGHIGSGSMIHLLGEKLARKNGFSLNHIVYKGVPPVTQDLMGGQIDLTFLPLGGNTLSMIESGKIKAYASTGPASSAKLPTVPAIAMSDKSQSDFVYGTWIALFVPIKTPSASIERLNKAFVAAMKDSDFQAYVMSTGMEPANGNSIADLTKFYNAESALYKDLAKSIGVQPNY
jgi:tripartite-type tricarboxylate transporter receptor subunit TctC